MFYTNQQGLVDISTVVLEDFLITDRLRCFMVANEHIRAPKLFPIDQENESAITLCPESITVLIPQLNFQNFQPRNCN